MPWWRAALSWLISQLTAHKRMKAVLKGQSLVSQQLACTNISTVCYRTMITLFMTPWRVTHRKEVRQLTVMEGEKKAESDDWHWCDVGHLLMTRRTGFCSSSIARLSRFFSSGFRHTGEHVCYNAVHNILHLPSKNCMLLVQICTRAECDEAGRNKDVTVSILSQRHPTAASNA